ncbi:glycoside hydrolase [Chytriomyces sp. MP71]|nr:glycoside hydrolase [Chytriomyces sp. MP71]
MAFVKEVRMRWSWTGGITEALLFRWPPTPGIAMCSTRGATTTWHPSLKHTMTGIRTGTSCAFSNPCHSPRHSKYHSLNTPIDALDTLYIMGLHAEYKAAKKLILAHDFSRINTTISIFETIIRVVGGLLAAYDLDGDKRVLRKCVELVDAMLPAFDTITGLPVNDFRISDGFKKVNDDKGVGLAEIGTFQLEFQYLSDVTGNPIYAEKALRVYEQLAKVKVPIPGLYPEKIHADNLTILGIGLLAGAILSVILSRVFLLQEK